MQTLHLGSSLLELCLVLDYTPRKGLLLYSLRVRILFTKTRPGKWLQGDNGSAARGMGTTFNYFPPSISIKPIYLFI